MHEYLQSGRFAWCVPSLGGGGSSCQFVAEDGKPPLDWFGVNFYSRWGPLSYMFVLSFTKHIVIMVLSLTVTNEHQTLSHHASTSCQVVAEDGKPFLDWLGANFYSRWGPLPFLCACW
jgi:hypothetical protein